MAQSTKGKYVDGFVLMVPKKNREAYAKMAKMGSKVWRKYGALDYKECLMDDATPPMIVLTFPKLTKVKEDEDVWFSFITFKSRKHRDQVNAKVMKEMEAKYNKDMAMPFDMKRMSYGGFKVVVG